MNNYMNINPQYVNQYIPQQPAYNVLSPQQAYSEQNRQYVLPGINNINPAYFNVQNLPSDYLKTGEINVPGVKNNAEMFKLSNGQKVIILPKEGPVFIRTSFGVGSLNEPDEIRGISHFIEHNLFNGSRDMKPGEYDKNVRNMGGSTNAYTGFAQTQYHLNLQQLDDTSLENAIKLNSELTQFPVFDEAAMQREKEPVKSEIDMCADNVVNKAYSTVIKNLFGIQSASDDLVIGTKENINNMTRDKLIDYYNTWYTPDNTVTVITGDVDVNETIGIVSKYFNKKPDYSNIQKRKFEPLIPINIQSRIDTKKNNGNDASIVLGFASDGNASVDEQNKLGILFDYIASHNSNLSKQLDKYGVSLNFFSEQLSPVPNASKVIAAEINLPEDKTEEVIKTIFTGLSELAQNPPKYEDVKSCANNMLHIIENNDSSENLSESLVYAVRENNLNYYDNFKYSVATVTPQELSYLAGKYLNPARSSMCVAHAKGTSDEQIRANYNLANKNNYAVSFGKSVNPSADLQKKLGAAETFVLNNNMNLTAIKTNSLTDCSLKMHLESEINPSISEAQTSVITEMLNRGSLYRNNAELKNEQNKFNTGIGFSASQNGIFISASFPAQNVNFALPLLKEALIAPRFTPEEFDRAKQIVKDSILNQKNNAQSLLNQTLYPNDMMFASKEKQLASIENMTLSDAQNIYYSIINNAQCNTVISAPEEYGEFVKNGAFSEFSAGLPMFGQFVPNKDGNVNIFSTEMQGKTVVQSEENAQAQIIQSYGFKDTGNVSDKAKIVLLNSILGGGMSSRLFEDCRNNEKLAYHVRSYTDRNYDFGTINLKIETSTDPEITEEASPHNITKSVNAFNRNVEKLKNENVSQEELQAAKNVCKTTLLNKIETSGDFTTDILDNKEGSIGIYYPVELLNEIDKVSVEDIKAAANYVFANKPVTSIVASQKTLETLNLI